MNIPKYQLKTGKSQRIFEFTSVGHHGSIRKRITYSKMTFPGLYNLALGDVNEKTGKVNYKNVTNNGDRDKVLATVVESVFSMFNKNPKIAIYLTGGPSRSRTRLYQMAISNYFHELEVDFEIFGKLNDEFMGFKKGVNFEAFIIILKEK